MKEEQRLFLVQAKSAYVVYRLLNADKSLHHCHALQLTETSYGRMLISLIHYLFAVAQE